MSTILIKEENNTKKNIIEKIYKCTFVKDSTSKTSGEFISSVIYNLIMSLIPFITFVPIIGSFFNGWNHSPWNLLVFIISIIYILDFIMRLFLIKLHYKEKTYLGALKKQILSIWSNYQIMSSITMVTLCFVYGTFNISGITMDVSVINPEVLTITLNVLLFINLSSIYSRLICSTINKENINIIKKLVFSKYKFYIFFVIFNIVLVLLFAYIFFSLESPTNDNITSMWDSIYLSFITMTTVGFGDVVAQTDAGKVFVIILACFGVCSYAFIGSFFVNLFVDFQNKKKSIQATARNSKEKEHILKYVLSSVDSLVLKNLHEAGLIETEKYEKILENRNKVEMLDSYEFAIEDFEFDYKSKKLYFKTVQMGIFIKDPYSIKNAEDQKWLAMKTIPTDQIHKTALYKLPFKLINEIKKEAQNFSIIFSSKNIDQSIKRLVFYQRKPFLSAVGEINVQTIISLEKDVAWKLFGDLTKMKSEKFNTLFAKNKIVTIIIVKELIKYEAPKMLERYGINTDNKIQDLIYLK
ncbi:MAG: ion channel [Mycoplasma sp.]